MVTRPMRLKGVVDRDLLDPRPGARAGSRILLAQMAGTSDSVVSVGVNKTCLPVRFHLLMMAPTDRALETRPVHRRRDGPPLSICCNTRRSFCASAFPGASESHASAIVFASDSRRSSMRQLAK